MTRIRIEPTRRRIRASAHGRVVADSTTAKLVFVEGRHPEYYFPEADVALDGGDSPVADDELGPYQPIGDLGRRYIGGATTGLVHFDFPAMDAWFEEDEQIYHHPRDPYRRVDVLESSRTVEVTIDGRTVATTTRPRLVDETGLPARWYVPRADLDWSVLEPSPTTSHCQYKGTASWWNVTIDPNSPATDVAWSYEAPIPEAPKLAGLVAFLAEHDRVETTVDGEPAAIPTADNSWISPSLHINNG